MSKTKQGKPYTIYSDNPKMNTAPYPDPEPIMVEMMGFAAGGFVPMGAQTTRDRLIDRADRDRRSSEMMAERMEKMERDMERQRRRRRDKLED